MIKKHRETKFQTEVMLELEVIKENNEENLNIHAHVEDRSAETFNMMTTLNICWRFGHGSTATRTNKTWVQHVRVLYNRWWPTFLQQLERRKKSNYLWYSGSQNNDLGTYLGVSIIDQHITKNSYSFLVDKMRKKLSCWQSEFFLFCKLSNLNLPWQVSSAT